MRPDLSPKQREFYYGATAALNIAEGAIRSGKTHVNLHRFAIHTQVAPPGELMMLGRTRETIERNAINPLKELWGPRRIRYNRGLGIVHVGNRPVWVVGVNDAQAETKIRGSTLAGSYINEVTVLQEEAFDQLYDRHSIEGAKIFGDTNPDSPYHWLKVKWLDNEKLTDEDFYSKSFRLSDNPYLPESYVQRLMRSHTGLWYRRMVEGEWVAAEGAVYPMFDPALHVVNTLPVDIERAPAYVGADYGTASVTAWGKVAVMNGVGYVFDEYRHNASNGRQKTDLEFARDFVSWQRPPFPQMVAVDPSAASFKLELRNTGVSNVRDADNAVIDGIRLVSTLLAAGKLKIHVSCEALIQEMSTYSWDTKAQERGEDKPVKKNDHSVDWLRYAVQKAFGKNKGYLMGVG